MNKRKICVVTGTRAEYGLLYWLINGVADDPKLDLQIVATGMHLSPEFGLTYKQIIADGFRIDRKLEMLLSADTPSSISKSIGLGIIGFSDVFNELAPNMIVLLGDRFEALSCAIAATMARIPIAHFHGGEATEGLIDEPIRHSITKMSHLHFAAAEEYRSRIIQMGESPNNVYNVGGMGIDNIKKLDLLDKNSLEKQLNFKLGKRNLLVTFHPVTLEEGSADGQFSELLKSLEKQKNAKIIFTKPNADTEGRQIIAMIDRFVEKDTKNRASYISLGQLRYLSLLQYVDCVLGNSSSGLLEVPTFKTATINIGDRQRGRLKASSVVDCEPNEADISQALEKVFSDDFKKSLPTTCNPYGDGGASEKALEILKNVDLSNTLKKKFYNIEFPNK